jgi:hypothetical protein
MKEGVKYEVSKETVTRTEELPDGRVVGFIYRGRDFGGNSLEKSRLDKRQKADGVPQEQRVTLPKRQQGS